MGAVGRGAVWLLPAGRRDWLAALWAEAHEVPPGLPRMAWRAGGAWVAGVLANGTAAMFTTTLGTGLTMLTLRCPWLLYWFAHGRHMTALATYRYGLNATEHAGGYVLMLMSFPIIGLFMSSLAAAIANPAPPDALSPSPGLPITSGE